ncbi:hypothetical protein [Fluviibacter phosphoraccumulans]|nr:hypothetical protein [Fluviibacter phosphoraccumulans]
MKNRILHLTRNTIPYVKELHPIAGGVLGCLVMQQLDYWFEGHPEGYYKFLMPSDHPAYKIGDSWTEELGMSKDEFRTAFDKIGIRYKSKSEFDQAVDKFQGRFYCSYVDRRSNLTYYFRNHDLVDAALDELLSKPAQKQAKQNPPSTANPHRDAEFTVKRESRFTGNQESRFTGSWDSQSTGNEDSRLTVNRENPPPLYRDYNTETTTTTVHSNAMDSGGCGDDLIFPKCTPEESIAIGELLTTCPMEFRQKALDEIEGARQAGVIKTNLVPFARGIMAAITRGTFTVGHGTNVVTQRNRQTGRQAKPRIADQPLDTKFLDKGKAFIDSLGQQTNH